MTETLRPASVSVIVSFPEWRLSNCQILWMTGVQGGGL